MRCLWHPGRAHTVQCPHTVQRTWKSVGRRAASAGRQRAQAVAARQAVDPSPPPTGSTDDDAIEEMAQLAEEEIGLLVSEEGQLGRGLMAAEDLQKQVVVSIPMYHALTVSDSPLDSISVFGDTMLDEWQEVHGALPDELVDFIRGDQRWDVRLTAWLLWLVENEGTLKAKSPKWAANAGAGLWDIYLHLLPDEKDMSCLLNYTAEEAVELQAKRMIEEASIQHDWIVHLHDRYFSKKSAKGPASLQLAHSLKETLWASAMVRSRTFSEEVNGEGITLMVPWADLANHSCDYNSTFGLSKDKECFELRTLRPLAAGDEILISYGDNKTNAELMRDYGFVVPGNPWDRLPTRPGEDLFLTEEEETNNKESAQSAPKLNGASLCESSDMEGSWSKGELQAMSDSLDTVSDEADWERRRCAILSLPLSLGNGGTADKPRKLSASDVTSERLAIAQYFDRWAKLKSEMPTTLASDEQLLSDDATLQREMGRKGGLTARQRAAVRYRVEYKKLLNQGLEILRRYDDGLAESINLPGKK